MACSRVGPGARSIQDLHPQASSLVDPPRSLSSTSGPSLLDRRTVGVASLGSAAPSGSRQSDPARCRGRRSWIEAHRRGRVARIQAHCRSRRRLERRRRALRKDQSVSRILDRGGACLGLRLCLVDDLRDTRIVHQCVPLRLGDRWIEIVDRVGILGRVGEPSAVREIVQIIRVSGELLPQPLVVGFGQGPELVPRLEKLDSPDSSSGMSSCLP